MLIISTSVTGASVTAIHVTAICETARTDAVLSTVTASM
jgi:hypothetical protein